MIAHHYGTDLIPRKEVKPGTAIKYNGRDYRASANVSKGLYAFSLLEKTIIKHEFIEVYLNQSGKPLMH
ncbi:MAG: kil [Proteobacteria bacterium]|uniref:cell division protein FtsZ n=1 Tax=Citrobacter freundii TaxID=546 RepID=UPI00383A60CB|nr:kil [Pseudomonadota bacterium]